jgi:hypothetical protein
MSYFGIGMFTMIDGEETLWLKDDCNGILWSFTRGRKEKMEYWWDIFFREKVKKGRGIIVSNYHKEKRILSILIFNSKRDKTRD